MERISLILYSAVCAFMLLLCACGGTRNDGIEGCYASFQAGEYSISYDTLVVSAYGEDGDFRVIRRSTFQGVRNGKLQPAEQKLREYIGKYDASRNVLDLPLQGKKISFFPDKGSLLLMQREYHKVFDAKGNSL